MLVCVSTHACSCAWAGEEGGEAIVSDDDEDRGEASSSDSDSERGDAQGARGKGRALRPFARLSTAQVSVLLRV